MAASLETKSSADTQQIVCYHCATVQSVSRRAQTLTCRKCHKALQIGDLKIKSYEAKRRVETTGEVLIDRRGQIVAEAVVCSDLVVRGQVKAKNGIIVRGTALIGAEASVIGDLGAHRVAIGAGATLAGNYCIGKDQMVPMPAAEPARA
jgi:hypothetical protein